MRLQNLLTLALMVLSLSFSLSAAHAGTPRVSMPNGELTLSNTDISVKVLGGQIAVARTWTNGRWYLNTAWAPLKFKLDTATSEVKYVDRAGSVYERSGNGDVYMFDYAYFIRRDNSNGGWRWYL